MDSGAVEGVSVAQGGKCAAAFAYSVVFIGDNGKLRFEVFNSAGERSKKDIVADLAAAAARLDLESD